MKFKGCQGMSGQKYVDEKVKFKALEKLTAEKLRSKKLQVLSKKPRKLIKSFIVAFAWLYQGL